jgi:hypothetical protein
MSRGPDVIECLLITALVATTLMLGVSTVLLMAAVLG